MKYIELLKRIHEIEDILISNLETKKDREVEDEALKAKILELAEAVCHKQPHLEAPAAPALEEEDLLPVYSLEDEEEEEVKVQPEREKAEPKKEEPGLSNRKLSFSINDKFLYIREVFDGNAEALHKAADKISDMKDYAEAEEYMLNELKLTPEANNTHAEFMALVERYF